MAGHSRSKNGVASLAYDPAIPIRGAVPLLSEVTGSGPVTTMQQLTPYAGSPPKNPSTASLNACGWSMFAACPALGITAFLQPGIFAAM